MNPRTPRAAGLAALCIAAALLGTGCGSSLAHPKLPSSPADVAFRNLANAICRDVNDRVASLPALSGSPQPSADDIATLNQGAALVSGGITRLQAVSAPPASRAAFARLLSLLREEQNLSHALIQAATHTQQSQLNALAGQVSRFARMQYDDATPLGLTDCASSSKLGSAGVGVAPGTATNAAPSTGSRY